MILTHILVLVPMAITYMIGVGLDDLGAYSAWYGTSPVMHSIGGFVTAWTVWAYTKLHVKKTVLKKVPQFARIGYLVGATLIVGVLWEWHEYTLDVLYMAGHIPSIGDLLLDLTMDAFGAVVYSVALFRIDKK